MREWCVRERVPSLDYIRGLMAVAVAVMLYHYTDWSLGGTAGVLSKLGIYAVSVFYVLSGLSLTLAYRERLGGAGLAAYAVRRAFRIAPLFWLATTATLAIGLARSVARGATFVVDPLRLLANYSLTFGFHAPDAYYATGAWSIGNEIVFYALFPLALWLLGRGLVGRTALTTVALGLLALFAFRLLSPTGTLGEQWLGYIHPLGQFPFFAAGMLVALLQPRQDRSGRVGFALLALAAVLLFVLLPHEGNRIGLVVGVDRLAYTAACVAAVAGVYLAGLRLRGVAHRLFAFLGDTSYSIYLLHPIMAFPIGQLTERLGADGPTTLAIHLLVGTPLTLLAAWLSYRFVEQPGIRLGQRVASRWRKRQAALRQAGPA